MNIDYTKKMGIEFYNIDILGELNYRYKILNPKNSKNHSLLRPIIIPQITKEKSKFKDAEYVTGYLNPNLTFFSSHLYFKYVCLKKLDIKKYSKKMKYGERITHKIEISFDVYSKDFSENKDIRFEVDLNYNNIPQINLICDTINWLNLYVDNENNICELNHFFPIDKINDYLKDRNYGIIYNKQIILETISNLEFEYFSNGIYRPRKDDDFWNEIEISNLPKNKYLKELIQKTLKDSGYKEVETEKKEMKDQIFVFITEYNTKGNMFWHRGKEELKPEILDKITSILKIGMHINFNELECIYGMIRE